MESRELYRGGKPQAVFTATPCIPWYELGSITAAQAYPAVGARDYTAVAALTATKRVIWDVPEHVTSAMLAFQTNADADAHVVQVLGFGSPKMLDAAGASQSDHAMFLGQLTLTGGKQAGPHSNFFVDSIVAVDGVGIWTVFDHAGDRIAVAKFDTKGLKTIVFIASELQLNSTLRIQARTY